MTFRHLAWSLLDTNLIKVPAMGLTRHIASTPRARLLDASVSALTDAEANQLIAQAIHDKCPFMAARFGATEFLALDATWLLRFANARQRVRAYLTEGRLPIASRKVRRQMQEWSGFFPPSASAIEAFGDLMVKDMRDVDLLASWIQGETLFSDVLKDAAVTSLSGISPFAVEEPWTAALRGKHVLVVHPFAQTITDQFTKHRADLFKNSNILPEFELQTIAAVQSIAGNKTSFSDWFAALDHMKSEMQQKDFDVAIIGCGAYGFPLAAHAKRMGKTAIQLAGITQLLFGIMGARWENNHDIVKWKNEHWVRPSDQDRPDGFRKVEGGCYW